MPTRKKYAPIHRRTHTHTHTLSLTLCLSLFLSFSLSLSHSLSSLVIEFSHAFISFRVDCCTGYPTSDGDCVMLNSKGIPCGAIRSSHRKARLETRYALSCVSLFFPTGLSNFLNNSINMCCSNDEFCINGGLTCRSVSLW